MVSLGLSSPARAESEPCACTMSNQSVVSEVPCLVIRASASSCEYSNVRNACDEAVTLVDWPLASCPNGVCSVELLPEQAADFVFTGIRNREEPFHVQSGTVRRDGVAHQVAISAEILCVAHIPPRPNEGCSAAPGAWGAAGLTLLAGVVARRRRARAHAG
ncbi:hypothetical protein A176_006891 [Myxococcus hansupus]|uniref:Uncharacterized protein n=2 Tax=Pseudomyxococcus hansupus TaxID=1297742 RepID=A0A0H4X458_9BACT|nr:hypothetical protein A176_006891 [Myxococcus hansupus]